ncbi:sensor histidine kinase [Neiella marina]|uniref:histidine kinase n=1 Tax=Neiella holothuriorum TaxID=2870530 RepID=A0ABS7EF87_9GAMM|nr:sensor histidine kinase [Neiella holothuriorum]MBW8190996.1 sensor histidine kinase [Neiella holothuriorum]
MKTNGSLWFRNFLVSMAIISAVTLALANVYYNDKQQSLALEYGGDLLERLPMVIETMVTQGVSFEGTVSEQMPLQGYMGALCDDYGEVIWKSVQAKAFELDDLCQQVKDNNTGTLTTPVWVDDGKLFFAHVLSGTFNGIRGEFVALRDGQAYEQWRAESVEKSLITVVLFLVGSGLALYMTFRWAMRPLKTLERELQSVSEQKQSALNAAYPYELKPVVTALNSVMGENIHRSQRYRHSLNDLAHSLKTRLAAMNVVCQENSIAPHVQNELLTNLSQMNAMVQYQLKRGLTGQQALNKQATPLLDIVDNLHQLLDKIYADKQIALDKLISKDDEVPMGKDDLMEIMGNLLENSFRYAISKLRISHIPLANGGVQLRIEDDGPGIDPSRREQVFQRGVRLDEKPTGQGIGLAVCADIVESYRGDIRIEESELEGACFVIELPPAEDWWDQ